MGWENILKELNPREIAEAKQAQMEQAMQMEQEKMNMEKARILIQDKGTQTASKETEKKPAKQAKNSEKKEKVKS